MENSKYTWMTILFGGVSLLLRCIVVFGLIAGTGSAVSDNEEPTLIVTETFCGFLERTNKSIQEDLARSFPEWQINCSILDDCEALNCSLKDSERKGGLRFNLCKKPPSVMFWKGSFWNHTFKVEQLPQRVEILHQQNVPVNEGFLDEPKRWFLTVHLAEDPKSNIITFNATLDICDDALKSNSSCSSIHFINSTRFSLSQICDIEEISHNVVRTTRLLAASPSQRLDHIHANAQSSNGVKSSQIGKHCSTSDPFFCGNGATCDVTPGGQGVCECLENYHETINGCVDIPPQPISPNNDAVVDENSSSSAALGAVLSVIALISLAGFIFLGTKYHVFSRMRNRLYYLRSSFRRSRSTIDHVSMVNPISSEDDDPPLL